MPRMYVAGNAHIDPIWLWRWSEGQQVIRSTFLSQLRLLKQRQDYVFCASSASFYKVIELTDPTLFEEIRGMIGEGRWEIVGGWWVEPDCNLPSGEALARHSLYGQRYFSSKFGLKAKVGYSVDSFGHNAMIPQILKRSGIDHYVFMRPGQHEKELPFWAFRWRSPDGSTVIAHRIPTYIAAVRTLKSLIETMISEMKSPVDVLLLLMGQGDHGGGPTIQDILEIDRLGRETTSVQFGFSPIEGYFGEISNVEGHLPLVAEELQHHASGCYSALSRIKQLNRKTEEALIAAEKLNFMASMLSGMEYHGTEFYRAWTNLLFCQFHDVLAGSCIREAYEFDVFPMLEEALSIANRISDLSTQSMASKIRIHKDKSIIVFNPNAFAVRYPVEVNWIWQEHPESLSDGMGGRVQCQIGEASALSQGISSLVFVVDIPPLGYNVFEPLAANQVDDRGENLIVGQFSLENRWLRIQLNETDGSIEKLTLKNAGQALVKDGAQALVLDDESDTWSHGVFQFDQVIGRFSCEKMEVVERGPVRGIVRARYRYGASTIKQDFVLYADLDYLLCKVDIDWHEKRKMLKLMFPVMVNQPEAVFEIQYGLVKRPTNGEEEPGLRWVDLSGEAGCNGTFGLTVINDSKYSYDVNGNALRITALRSPAFAHHDPLRLESASNPEYIDQGRQSFTYILRPHEGKLRPWEAIRIADSLIASPVAIIESEHEGILPKIDSMGNISEAAVIMKVIKKAEEDGGWITRIYETSGSHVRTKISLPALRLSFDVVLGPFEIKTFLIPEEGKVAKETNLIEEYL